jgi:hypothetical protein
MPTVVVVVLMPLGEGLLTIGVPFRAKVEAS